MRTAGFIASCIARHAIAFGIVCAVACVLWILTYLILFALSILSNAGMGSPAAFPIGLILVLATSAMSVLLLFLPATIGAEIICRRRNLPTLFGIPFSFGLFCLLSLLWSTTATFAWGFDYQSIWTMALGIVLILAVPLGLYWWVAESPRIAFDAIKAMKHLITNKQTARPIVSQA